MTSYRENRLNSTDKKITISVTLGTNIERTFAFLKKRFRNLLTVLDMEHTDCFWFCYSMLCLTQYLLKNNDLTMAELDLIQDNYNLQSLMKGRNRHIGQVKEIISVMNLMLRNM